MGSSSVPCPSIISSYTERLIPIGSRNEIELLAWGSRSRRSVLVPRRANAAARLMAVVVLPTPPFWLVIAIINVQICLACEVCHSFKATSANRWHRQLRRASLLLQFRPRLVILLR